MTNSREHDSTSLPPFNPISWKEDAEGARIFPPRAEHLPPIRDPLFVKGEDRELIQAILRREDSED